MTAQASIPVDLLNPGQVFACVGFAEAADVLLGDAEGGFDWSDAAEVRFVLRAAGDENPFAVVLRFLHDATVSTQAPAGSENTTAKWGVPTETLPGDDAFPFADPDSPATLPAVLRAPSAAGGPGESRLVIDYWGDTSGRDNVKFWGGAGGYPGAALTHDALELVRDRLTDAHVLDPFDLGVPQSSSFRFDWRRDYIPLDAGFSLNAHARMETCGFPVVELLAGIGLTHARPQRLRKLEYRYGVVGVSGHGELLDLIYLRAALGSSKLPFRQRSFRMRLGWPGQEDQARCITTVTEETNS